MKPRPFYVYVGHTNCDDCGRKLKKFYHFNDKRYGSECIKKYVPEDEISQEELDVPPWLLQVAEDYVQYRISESKETGFEIEDGDDFTINFYNIDCEKFGATMVLTGRDGIPLVDNGKTIKINGKPVKHDWQTAIYYYLLQRREELDKNTNMLVVGDDEATLHPHGGLSIRGGVTDEKTI